MDNSQTLELQIKTKAQEAKASVEGLVRSLTNVENVLTNIYLEMGNIEKKADSSINKTTTTATKNVNQLKQTSDKATDSVNKLSNAFKNVFTFTGVKRITGQLLGWVNEAIDYTEQLNLFNVVFDNTEKNGKQMFSELGKSALQFQYQLNEAFGTNKTQTLYMQGIFQSMGETVGIKDKYSAIMSETMTKLTYDLASLYNKTEKNTAEAIRAGVYAGQTKPLRSYGIDVTQSSLQPIVKQLGITDENGDVKSVKNMSQAEKEILRYIATLKQAKIAMGDLANTIESPSNQIKVFRQQLVEAKVALSSLFIGGLSNILPYANAFLMVVKEMSKAIASMFGIELKDYNSGIASQEGIYDGIADSADDASKKVKELRRQTLGFDEIHNINENKDKSDGSSSGGIDQRLLDAITGYDNGMDKVRMKATQIRDRIMEWLGFHKKINPLTGEVYFEYQGIKKTLQNIWKSFKGLSTQGKVLVGLGLVVGATKLWNTGKKLVDTFGDSGLGKVIKKLLSPMKSLYNSLDNVNYANKALTSGLAQGITEWSKSLTAMDKFKVTLVGILGLSASMSGMVNAMKSVSNEGWNLGNSLQTVGSALGGIASGAYIGSIFGPWGTVIGGATGAVLELSSAIIGYQSEIDKVAEKTKNVTTKTKEYIDSINEQNTTIQESVTAQLANHEYNKRLLEELGLIVEENGKIKKGYEDRANFIVTELNTAYGTEYKVVDGVIQKYGDLTKTIKELIRQKEIEILLEGKKQQYSDAVKNQYKDYLQYEEQLKAVRDAESKLVDAQNEVTEARKRMQKALTFGAYLVESAKLKKAEESLKNLTGEYDNAKNKLEELKNTVVNNGQIISDYSSLTSASVSGDLDTINKAIENSTTTWVENGEIQKASLSDQMKYLDYQYNVVGVGITNEYYESTKQGLLDTLISMSTTTTEMTPEIVEAWATLGELNKDSFIEKFKGLNDDLQREIINKMQEKGYSISDELQKGINQINPTIKIKADTTKARNVINTFLQNLKKSFSFGGVAGGILGQNVRYNANGGVYSNGSWKNIQQYANGGTPSRGTLFWAGEAGAEVVAHANRKTEVLNQSQIASAIYSATLSAMSQVMSQYGGQSSEIDVHVHTDEGTVIDRIEQRTKQTGVFPFTIPTC